MIRHKERPLLEKYRIGPLLRWVVSSAASENIHFINTRWTPPIFKRDRAPLSSKRWSFRRSRGGGGRDSLKMTNVPIVDRIVKCNNQNGSNSRLERRGRFLSLSMWKMKQIPASNKNWSFVLFCIPCSDNLTTFFWRSAQLSLFCSIFLCQFMHPFLFACFHFCFFPVHASFPFSFTKLTLSVWSGSASTQCAKHASM